MSWSRSPSFSLRIRGVKYTFQFYSADKLCRGNLVISLDGGPNWVATQDGIHLCKYTKHVDLIKLCGNPVCCGNQSGNIPFAKLDSVSTGYNEVTLTALRDRFNKHRERHAPCSVLDSSIACSCFFHFISFSTFLFLLWLDSDRRFLFLLPFYFRAPRAIE
jgi:hypothetical protein